ncbi:hypothetical protein FQN60_003910 [Etheostoma spectabile]|uniref:TNF family profile domain-containing protein n=1 Tax=Etheostoma spectabile TaxID=54343 RepID=A0A5J5CX26_9PERO|nr:hypothetical protein FQN60_003910 [Etheostoma spectabile]
MPQHTQHSLIHVLLLWITILSIVQVVFIVLFFTAGHHDLPPSDHGLPLGKGLMLTFKITAGVNRTIKFVAKNPHPSVVSDEGKPVLNIKMDGYFFLSLRVTLSSCNASQYTVTLKTKDNVILKGWINENTCSTGLLSKVEVLSAGATLVIDLPANARTIDEENSHLDIIYILKP